MLLAIVFVAVIILMVVVLGVVVTVIVVAVVVDGVVDVVIAIANLGPAFSWPSTGSDDACLPRETHAG